jgi:hypothetical protein
VKNRSLIIFIIFLSLAANAFAQSKPAPSQAKSKSVSAKPQSKKTLSKKTTAPKNQSKATAETDSELALTAATSKLKADLAEEIAHRESSIKKLSDDVEKKKQLFTDGILPKGEVEQSEAKLFAARKELDTRKQLLKEADNVIAEAQAMDKLLKMPPMRLGAYSATAALIRYNGASVWTLNNIAKVDSFFVGQFKHSLPVSAFGQTATHDRLGFDHRNSVDVAIHPDSAEGQALIAYLRNAGIPFLAFRQAVPGTATGAHIHIGYPSRRMF